MWAYTGSTEKKIINAAVITIFSALTKGYTIFQISSLGKLNTHKFIYNIFFHLKNADICTCTDIIGTDIETTNQSCDSTTIFSDHDFLSWQLSLAT